MYILEGNIGVGKTTFLSLIQKTLKDIEVLTEPVEDWSKQKYGQSLLANFYKDTPRWAYTLETLTMICRSKDHIREQENPNPNRILERSIYSGHYCFAKNSFESNCMQNIEWKIYNDWANFLLYKHCKPPIGFIYLKADPTVCFERVKKRNRESEKDLTLDYLKKIDFYHDKFLIEKKDISEAIKRVPVIVIDCNEDFVQNHELVIDHSNKIKRYLARTQENRSHLYNTIKNNKNYKQT